MARSSTASSRTPSTSLPALKSPEREADSAHPLGTVFARCAAEAVSYCLLRDADATEASRGGEFDLLVAEADAPRLVAILHSTGFVRLGSWGRAPHTFFIRYDELHDRWIKCDVVTAVAFGRPVHNLWTDLGDACLAARRGVGPAFAPCVEDELITLLLHEMLDKGGFRPHRVARLVELRWQVTRVDRVSGHLARYWPGMTWVDLSAAIDGQRWDDLLSQRTRVERAIAAHAPLRTRVRGLRDRLLRTLYRATGLLHPHAPSLALLAPDGAGKSTLTSGIEGRFFGPVCSVYMGLYQKATARSRAPGLGLVSLLMTQWRRYLRGRRAQASGHLVLFDRYSYDALLPGKGSMNALRRLRRWLLAWTVPGPSVTVILDAPGDMLFARKGEHSVDALEHQRQAYLQLAHRLPRATVVNAQQDPSEVRRAVTRLLWREYRNRASQSD